MAPRSRRTPIRAAILFRDAMPSSVTLTPPYILVYSYPPQCSEIVLDPQGTFHAGGTAHVQPRHISMSLPELTQAIGSQLHEIQQPESSCMSS